MAGFGRTGRCSACENWDVVPDIITVAMGINSGYVPLGAMIFRKHIADWVRDKFFPGGLTYAGHPPACASAVASIEAYQEEGVVENAAEVGSYLEAGLRGLAERHLSIGEVRGLGCFWGVELVKSRETREMLVPFNAAGEAAGLVARLAKAALERLYLMTHWNVIMVVPPLTITRDEVDDGLVVRRGACDSGRVRDLRRARRAAGTPTGRRSRPDSRRDRAPRSPVAERWDGYAHHGRRHARPADLLHRGVEVADLEPDQHAVAEWLVEIGQKAVVIFDIGGVELQHDLAVRDDLLVVASPWPPSAASTCW